MNIQKIDVNKLVLDTSNPRFAELYNGSKKEDDLIEYLLFTESAEEVAKGISLTKNFYPDRALWVLEKGKKYLVKDGNRRCAAVKALQSPKKHGLDLPKLIFRKLPVLIYKDKKELERRIREEHTASLFKEWDRIAKALEVYRMHRRGSSVDSMKEMDSNPSELIKLASFYYAAVEIAGDNLKTLLRRGRKTGGKTIVFERLFQYKYLCGYKFKNKPSYEIEIEDESQFSSYILSLVQFLIKNPDITHGDVDEEGDKFLQRLKKFGFIVPRGLKKKKGRGHTAIPRFKNVASVKKFPNLERKQLHPNIKRLVDECYKLDENLFANAKLALTRITFECVLKYILEETKFAGKKRLIESAFFKIALYSKKGQKRPYTDFTALKSTFSKLIVNKGKKKAFEQFDVDKPSQIIHNYNVGGVPANATSMCDNLMPLLEFMLQDETDLLKSLDLSKL